MSLTKDVLEKHLKDPAVFCCRRQKGLVISGADLEDPDLFEDMADAGLLALSKEGLTIEQVLGRKLETDTEALTPITAAMLDGINAESPEAKPESGSGTKSASGPEIKPEVKSGAAAGTGSARRPAE